MAECTREYCLAKIAELEQKVDVARERDAHIDYLQMLECWRWLAKRLNDRPEALANG
jgi:hypothetical protein